MKRKTVPRLMSVDELADYLGLQKQTIYNWLHSKKITGMKIGKVWRFDRRYIDGWIKECSRG
ncbi:MAG: helix-turn-helix domain-containing protein [Candidatus Omnitrophica bacterium]|nr:helix-turn-helix domain-containing protein [Candidatus Omnitrophota bacterium]MBU2044683.1 helix-turn-helix domain-containing protein [Candidatus Omnitrophota bacterium]MBU2250735.1 helix-turn-helix domain-containing protein [Candidatus Omnitrophota bacterium]MBU2265427.1 helix-turn-helix domain-containing protein [Candidatus Omnitrophota bacterium]MBU2474245.1 helix-turn-helix domain-containing protein [Candidatus Omnitrophota bacterium]